ncbi:MAG: c-type cytochrome [Chloroflexi bacterium]|nr:c-type cytochrome [Chloroflexota bacterium]
MCRQWSRRAVCLVLSVVLSAAALAGCTTGAAARVPPDPPAVATGSPAEGQAIFNGQVAIAGFVACAGCHAVDPAAGPGIGPNLAAIARVANERVAGLMAAEYIERSIRVHDEYVVPGYAPGIARSMLGAEFGEVLSDAQVSALVAYLLALPASVAAATPPPATASATPSATTVASATPSATTVASATPGVTPSATAVASATASATTVASATPSATTVASATPGVTPSATVVASATPVPPSATAVASASATAVASATSVPSATPPPAPTPEPPPPTATPTPVAAVPTPEPLPSAPDDPDLGRYAGCVSCHNQHPLQVRMPHPLNPTCNECHRGSPNRIGCPTCHSTHGIDNRHEPLPDLACASCHP